MPHQQERNDSQQAGASRRDFMKASAASAAGAAAAMAIPASGVYAQTSAEVKVALIGCGGRGSGAANQALATNSTVGPCKLVAMGDAFEDRMTQSLNNLKAEHGDKVAVDKDKMFVGFDAYQKVLDTNPDLVILATPPGFRPIHFEAAVKAGKHVFMEKPVATDAVGVRKVLEIAKLAKEKNLKVGVGLQRHHEAKYIETVKRIQDGAIGELPLMRVYWNDAGVWVRPRKPGQTEMEYQMRNWYYFNWLCGDHINEQHIHNLDVANWVKNAHPVSAIGMGGRQVRNGIDHGEIYDHHFVEYTYADGTKVASQCRHQPGCWKSVSEHAHGTKGHADISGGRIQVAGGEAFLYKNPAGRQDPYQVEHNELFDAIRNNKPYNEAEYGAFSTMTAIMGRMATYSGEEVFWDAAAAQKAGKKPADAPLALDSKLDLQPESYAWDAKPRSLPDENGRYYIPIPGVKNKDHPVY
jgi:myo-inositol 2-dehydrogenase/D-chiro-inositol 1-dehydrogenase